jgi:hypothetical protein
MFPADMLQSVRIKLAHVSDIDIFCETVYLSELAYPLVAVMPEALWSQLKLHFIFGGEMSVRMSACLSAVQKIIIQ